MNWSAFLQCVLLIGIGAGAAAAFFRWSNATYFDASNLMSRLNDRMMKTTDSAIERSEHAYDRAVEMLNAQAARLAAYEDKLQESLGADRPEPGPDVVEQIAMRDATNRARRRLNDQVSAGTDGTGKVDGRSRIHRAMADVAEFEDDLKASQIRDDARREAENDGRLLVNSGEL